MVQHGHFLNATDRAGGGAALAGKVFPPHILERVFLDRDPGIAPLLRTVVDQAILADVDVAGAGAAAPIVWSATR